MSEADLPKLPDFDRPPVVETLLSAQFELIAGMSTVHFGLFWQRIRDEFPRTEERPALEPAFERFGERPRRDRRFRIEVREDARPQRMWFVNEPGIQMIQLQMDRFIKNWRKTGDDEVYPRYEQAIKPGFGRRSLVAARPAELVGWRGCVGSPFVGGIQKTGTISEH